MTKINASNVLKVLNVSKPNKIMTKIFIKWLYGCMVIWLSIREVIRKTLVDINIPQYAKNP